MTETKLRPDKLLALYRQLNLTGDLNLTNLDRFKVTENYIFRNSKWW